MRCCSNATSHIRSAIHRSSALHVCLLPPHPLSEACLRCTGQRRWLDRAPGLFVRLPAPHGVHPAGAQLVNMAHLQSPGKGSQLTLGRPCHVPSPLLECAGVLVGGRHAEVPHPAGCDSPAPVCTAGPACRACWSVAMRCDTLQRGVHVLCANCRGKRQQVFGPSHPAAVPRLHEWQPGHLHCKRHQGRLAAVILGHHSRCAAGLNPSTCLQGWRRPVGFSMLSTLAMCKV